MNGQRPVGTAVALTFLLLLAGTVFWLGRPRPHGAAPATPPGLETGRGETAVVEPGARGDASAGPAVAHGEVVRAEPPSSAVGSGAERPARPEAVARPHGAVGGSGDASDASGDAATEPAGPSFDLVRVEPSGEAVIAGRGAPNAAVELVRNGEVFARGLADGSGLFALVPPPLPPGSHEVVLRTVAPNGARARSRDSVTVVVGERRTPPLVALASPDRPTVILSQPEPPGAGIAALQPGPDGRSSSSPPTPATRPNAASEAPARSEAPAPVSGPPAPSEATARAGPAPALRQDATVPSAPGTAAPPRRAVKVVSVEAEEGGKLYVSGEAAPGSTVRLYLNETLIAPGGVGRDGRVAFAIGRGVRPGGYRVRLDDVDPVSGAVKSRAEVAFNVPEPLGAVGQGAAPATAARSGQRGGASSPSAAAEAPSVGGAGAQPQPSPSADQPPRPAFSAAPAGTARPTASPAPSAGSTTVGSSAQAPAPAGPRPPAPAGLARGASPRPITDPTGDPTVAAAGPPAPATLSVAPPMPDTTPARPSAAREPSRPAAPDAPRPGGIPVPPLAPAEAQRPTELAATSEPTVAALRELDPGTIVVPEVNTAIVSRGETLWRISRRVYGRGLRYTVIYSANQEQIRNPRFIYPGQVFVLPGDREAARR